MALEDGFVEYLVKKKTSTKEIMIRVVCNAFIVCVIIGVPVFIAPGLAPVSLFVGVVLWLIYHNFILPLTDIEYEYSYCDKEISVDKIMGKEKRKNLATYQLEKMELLAPSNSYRLADYKNLKTVSYWSEDDSDDHVPYALIYDNKEKVLLDLNGEFVKIVQNNAPRKVYTD